MKPPEDHGIRIGQWWDWKTPRPRRNRKSAPGPYKIVETFTSKDTRWTYFKMRTRSGKRVNTLTAYAVLHKMVDVTFETTMAELIDEDSSFKFEHGETF